MTARYIISYPIHTPVTPLFRDSKFEAVATVFLSPCCLNLHDSKINFAANYLKTFKISALKVYKPYLQLELLAFSYDF